MALEPISIEFQSWEITNVTEEIVEPYKLPEMDKKEKELKKKLEGHVGPVLDAEDAVYVADDKIKNARTRAARRAAQREKEEAQAKFEEEREIHRQMQKEYNEAEDQARREEEIASFSLGIGNLPNIRDLSGETFAKQVDVEITSESGTKEYRFYLRRYVLTDETLDITHRGRWIIVKIEAIS
jgi:hypothetical protein